MLRVDIARKNFRDAAGGFSSPLFEDVSFSVAQGETCALVGPSGVGKTSLLAIVAGLDRAFAGEVAGRPAPTGYAFQTARLLPWLTTRRNLELVMPGRQEEAVALLEEIGLGSAGDVYPNRLSLGMARRVKVARALAVRPRLLILDEPFAALDQGAAERMQDLVARRTASLGATTLLVTHVLDEAVRLADRILLLAGSPARIAQEVAVDLPRDARRDPAAREGWRRQALGSARWGVVA